MPYTKTIVCLANSRMNNHFCVAGKEVLANTFGGWIRPVNPQHAGAISAEDQRLENGGHPQILDVISIPLCAHQPDHHQQENHVIAHGQWKKIRSLDKRILPYLLDSVAPTLWTNPAGHRKNDRVAVHDLVKARDSLKLIQPLSLSIRVCPAFNDGDPHDVRCKFRYKQHRYDLKVTDPVAEGKYRAKSGAKEKAGHNLPHDYPLDANGVYLCVSLTAKPVRSHCYKIVATVIGDPN